MSIQRTYGKTNTLGDVLYNKSTKTFFTTIKFGVFGQLTLTLVKNEGGTYNLIKPYTDKKGESQIVQLGKTFKVKNKDGKEVEGITQGTLGLSTAYDKELKKEISVNNNALYIKTHKLKEAKDIEGTDYQKVGWITGQIGVEIEDESTETNVETEQKEEVEKKEDGKQEDIF